mmetsp:Transcript_29681/g.76708  ORF Transcript_29681/g.76708 Transcript_29681/m.76708 type:complete len:226 (-) Transcript_29681:285-962(-)
MTHPRPFSVQRVADLVCAFCLLGSLLNKARQLGRDVRARNVVVLGIYHHLSDGLVRGHPVLLHQPRCQNESGAALAASAVEHHLLASRIRGFQEVHCLAVGAGRFHVDHNTVVEGLGVLVGQWRGIERQLLWGEKAHGARNAVGLHVCHPLIHGRVRDSRRRIPLALHAGPLRAVSHAVASCGGDRAVERGHALGGQVHLLASHRHHGLAGKGSVRLGPISSAGR